MGDLLIEKSGGTAINPAGFVAIYDADRAAVARHRRVVKAGPHDVQEPAVTLERDDGGLRATRVTQQPDSRCVTSSANSRSASRPMHGGGGDGGN